MAPIILRSQYVRYATHRMMGTAITTILIVHRTSQTAGRARLAVALENIKPFHQARSTLI